MVTFYRKAQINNKHEDPASSLEQHDLTDGKALDSRWTDEVFYTVANTDDDLTYVVVRPKSKSNAKKIKRMRSHWD